MGNSFWLCWGLFSLRYFCLIIFLFFLFFRIILIRYMDIIVSGISHSFETVADVETLFSLFQSIWLYSYLGVLDCPRKTGARPATQTTGY